jgi:transcriptional regulator with PAS, ATPase and Fis domain
MEQGAWVKELGAAVIVCDEQGVIVEMNDRACVTYEKDGGRALVGKNLLDCHPEPARSKVVKLLESREPNAYTIEKNGVKKLIYQAPWFEGGEFRGLVELALPIPFEMPHFVRTPK